MKNLAYKIKIVFLAAFLIAITAAASHAETVTQTATMQAFVDSIFSLEFIPPSTDPTILYTTDIPFTNIDASKSQCYSDGRTVNSGKNDCGLLCRTNMGQVWYLNMTVTANSMPAFPLQNFQFYMGQPTNRTRGEPSDGALSFTKDWHPVPTALTVMYTAGPKEYSNLEFGTLMTLSFAVVPRDIAAGENYYLQITYTLTATT